MLMKEAEKIFLENQSGFRVVRSTQDWIFRMKFQNTYSEAAKNVPIYEKSRKCTEEGTFEGGK